MAYLYLKSIHIIFVVSWMAGLFYVVRLFVYHVEAKDKPEPEQSILKAQYQIMESRLFNIITTPAMLLAVGAGLGMIYLNPFILEARWMIVKLFFVVGLIAYHFICRSIIRNLKANTSKWTSTQFRLWNEVATIFLVAIVFLAIIKNAVDWIYGLIGLILFAIIIMSAVKIYKYYRLKK